MVSLASRPGKLALTQHCTVGKVVMCDIINEVSISIYMTSICLPVYSGISHIKLDNLHASLTLSSCLVQETVVD